MLRWIRRVTGDGQCPWRVSAESRHDARLVRDRPRHQASAPFGGGPPARTVDPPGQGPCAGTRWPRESAGHLNLGLTALEADPHTPAGLQPAGHPVTRALRNGVTRNAVIDHDLVIMCPP